MHSALAPESSSSTRPPLQGSWVGSAARRMPRIRLVTSVAPDSSAPVLPAEIMASPSPSLTMRRATDMEESFLRRTAVAGSSCMSMTFSALRMEIGRSSAFSFASSSLMTASLPTRIYSCPNSRAAMTQPETMASGALSPLIASMISFMSCHSFPSCTAASSPSRCSSARSAIWVFFSRLPLTR